MTEMVNLCNEKYFPAHANLFHAAFERKGDSFDIDWHLDIAKLVLNSVNDRSSKREVLEALHEASERVSKASAQLKDVLASSSNMTVDEKSLNDHRYISRDTWSNSVLRSLRSCLYNLNGPERLEARRKEMLASRSVPA